MAEAVEFSKGCFHIQGKSLCLTISAADINTVYRCAMEDDVHQGDEHFHILVEQDSIIIIGSFVQGAIAAVEKLMMEKPQINLKSVVVRKIPYRFREPGILGLRLFPVPGLYKGAIKDLEVFGFTSREEL